MNPEPEMLPSTGTRSGEGAWLVAKIALFLVVLPTLLIFAVKWAFDV